MRCLLKLCAAIALAVLAQRLVQPGGVGDEMMFATRVYVGENYRGVAPDAPEIIDAASRLQARQGHMPKNLPCQPPCKLEDDDVAEATDCPACTDVRVHEPLACVH